LPIIFVYYVGDPIFSIHVQPNGPRFATGGGDATVKVWSLPAALDARQEENAATPKLLATISDHNGPVNVVRFSPAGSRIASGSDDGVACIFDFRPGPGGGVLGGETNVENWRTRHLLRGHASHIVDLCWSPDGAYLATASLDSTAAIWDAWTGTRVATLTAHTSFVKGVAWDPVGTYLATQSEDKSMAVWRADDWSLVARVKSPFRQMVSTTYSCRVSWSPDGRFLLAGNSYQGATHAAIAVPREAWNTPEKYLLVSGHGAAVVATAFCPKLFHVPPLGGGTPGEELSALFALGSQDKRMTVWASGLHAPLFCGSRIFKLQVTDMAWTVDGCSLLAVSLDGTVACLQFEASELGIAATTEEMTEVMRTLYGAAGGRPNKRVFAETVDQLELEDSDRRSPSTERRSVLTAIRQPNAPHVSAALAPKDSLAALDARLGGRMGEGAITQTGFGGGTAAGANTQNVALVSVPTQRKHPAKKLDSELMPPPSNQTAVALTDRTGSVALGQQQQQQQQQPPISAAHTGVREIGSAVGPPRALLDSPSVRPSLRIALGTSAPLLGDGASPLELQVINKSTSGGDVIAEICLMKADQPVWNDAVPCAVVSAVGSPSFSCLATADGHIILYSSAGRRRAPPLCIGAGVAILSAGPKDGRLLAVSTTGELTVFDVLSMQQVLQVQLRPLLEGGGGLMDVRLSKTGLPLVAMNDSSVYAWHKGCHAWMRVADDSMVMSNYAPVLQIAGQGEVIALQAAALATVPPLLGNRGSSTAAVQRHFSRSHAEASLAAAEAMEAPEDYRQWLTTYARGLADSGDEVRMRELSDSLLAAPMESSGARGGGFQSGSGSGSSTVLGLCKRELLRDIVLKEMARNRALGGLLQRCQLALDHLQQDVPPNFTGTN